MYQDLREAIKTYFNANATHPFYTRTSGHLAYYRAPASWETDYAVFALIDFQSVGTFDADIKEGIVGFNCYSDTAELADDMMAACVSMFAGKSVTANGNPVLLRHGFETPAIPSGDEENYPWFASVEFNVRIQR
jgi:hypothetical protein